MPTIDNERLRQAAESVIREVLGRCNVQWTSRDRPPEKRWYLCNIPGHLYIRLTKTLEALEKEGQ